MSNAAPQSSGRDLLATYLKNRNVTRFALRAGIDPSHIRKILSGHRTRLSVDVAVRIEDQTKGFVPVRAWCTPDLDEVEVAS
jgi:plasmid maintenance system antidote protein VapI